MSATVCQRLFDRKPTWGFVADDRFYPFGTTAEAEKAAFLYDGGDHEFDGVDVKYCPEIPAEGSSSE
jgi:hypothetical protein